MMPAIDKSWKAHKGDISARYKNMIAGTLDKWKKPKNIKNKKNMLMFKKISWLKIKIKKKVFYKSLWTKICIESPVHPH